MSSSSTRISSPNSRRMLKSLSSSSRMSTASRSEPSKLIFALFTSCSRNKNSRKRITHLHSKPKMIKGKPSFDRSSNEEPMISKRNTISKCSKLGQKWRGIGKISSNRSRSEKMRKSNSSQPNTRRSIQTSKLITPKSQPPTLI